MTGSAERQLAQLVAGIPTVTIGGRYYRCTSQRRVNKAFDGSRNGGRWGAKDTFPVLYLTDDYEACVIEAYRHLVDPGLDATPPPVNMVLVTCDVDVTTVLDLRTATARMQLGLDPSILSSEPQGLDGEAYRACSQVAQAAHQLQRHGILVPSATGRGHTLALFSDLLPPEEVPAPVGGVSQWQDLPADPRRLRIIQGEQDRS